MRFSSLSYTNLYSFFAAKEPTNSLDISFSFLKKKYQMSLLTNMSKMTKKIGLYPTRFAE